ncbi:MAG TPA: urate oxidase [Candidatus Acidoferrum sp.]|nr:urate oxidase [Candidatus Acidoferrum sp.]
MNLLNHRYGKARVRLMKVSRQGAQHSLKELTVSVLLEGDFGASYTGSDNRLVVPTDTIKNTVNLLAHQKLGQENEEFGALLGRHFLDTYPQVRRVEIELSERVWDRLICAGKPHAHSFQGGTTARQLATVACTREGSVVESGVAGLLILKTTDSGFEGYLKDKFTTLRETNDRILATNLQAKWTYSGRPRDYVAANAAALSAMLDAFAGTYSPSIQRTLFQMGEAALKAVPEIAKVSLSLPNQHCLLVDLSPLGVENKNVLFVPTDEPHGLIEGTVSRG